LLENPVKVKQRLGKFRWRSNVTTLRAPKHFKVGRQHYNRGRRCSIITVINKEPNQPSTSRNYGSLQSAVLLYPGLDFLEIQQPLSVTKTLKVTLAIRVNWPALV
jgi:hypothetical protein